MPPHYPEEGHAHYLTFGCYHHHRLFRLSHLCDLFLKHLAASRRRHGFALYAWVIMPNHIHLLLYPKQQTSLSSLLTSIKRPFSSDALEWLRLEEPEIADNLRIISRGKTVWRFWQHGGGYDRNVFGDETLRKTVEYIHNNPVRIGLSQTPEDYPWSSANYYLNGKSNSSLIPDIPENWT